MHELKIIILQFQEWLLYLRTKFALILIFAGCGMLAGAGYAYFKKTTYTAVSTFVLEDNGKSGSLGQYSNLASIVGLDIGGGSTNGIFQGDNIIELYKSRRMIVKTLLSSANFNGKNQPLIERYLSIYPFRKWKNPIKAENLRFNSTEKLTILHDSLLTEVVKQINEKQLVVSRPDKKLGIISVNYTAIDAYFAKTFNDLIVKNVNDFYIQTKIKKSADNVAVLQYQTDSIWRTLNGNLSGMAVAIDANPNANPARQILRVPSQRKQVDVEANKAVLTQLVANLELGKITLRQETPLIQLIDQPILPLHETKFSMLRFSILGAVCFMILSVLGLLAIRLFRKIMAD